MGRQRAYTASITADAYFALDKHQTKPADLMRSSQFLDIKDACDEMPTEANPALSEIRAKSTATFFGMDGLGNLPMESASCTPPTARVRSKSKLIPLVESQSCLQETFDGRPLLRDWSGQSFGSDSSRNGSRTGSRSHLHDGKSKDVRRTRSIPSEKEIIQELERRDSEQTIDWKAPEDDYNLEDTPKKETRFSLEDNATHTFSRQSSFEHNQMETTQVQPVKGPKPSSPPSRKAKKSSCAIM